MASQIKLMAELKFTSAQPPKLRLFQGGLENNAVLTFHLHRFQARNMLEALLRQGNLLKKLIDSIKELVTDANWDCNDSGIALQAMDTSHVALVALLLRAEGFDPYRCDRNMSLGINLVSMSKILKCAGSDDAITLTAGDGGDVLTFTFTSPRLFSSFTLNDLV